MGNRYTFVQLAEYGLTKCTDLYGTVDLNRATDAAICGIARAE